MNLEYLSPDQVEHLFPGLTASRLARWRWAHTGPGYTKVGRRLLYRRDVIEAFLHEHTVQYDAGKI